MLSCWLGIKCKFEYDDGSTSPFPFLTEKNCVRTCQTCGKKQQWLPGYGGSEMGCWETIE